MRPDSPRCTRVLLLLTAALALLLAACECTVEDLDRWVLADFEDCQDLCGWEVLEGSARVVRTYHPAQHALQLVGPRAVVRHALEPGARPCTESDCQMQFAVVTSCAERLDGEDALRLVARMVYRDPVGDEVTDAPTLECSNAGGTLRFCTGIAELGLPDPDGGEPWPPVALELEGARDGCVVDDVVLENFWIFCGA